MFFVQMKAGLMEIVRSLNRGWIYDTYFSLYSAIHPGGMFRYPIDSLLRPVISSGISTIIDTYMYCVLIYVFASKVQQCL